MTIWLVRHGQSTWNVARRIQGHADEAVLTDTGLRQADEVAERLAGEPVAVIYVSDLRRTRQTAAPLARRLGLPVRPDSRLRERHLGTLQGRPSSALVPALSGIADGRVVDPDARPPGGESLRELHRRADGFLADVAAGDERAGMVVVTHGGTLRMLRARLDAVPVDRVVWDAVDNAAIVRRTVGVAGAAAVSGEEPA